MNQIHNLPSDTKCVHCGIVFPKRMTMGKTDGKLRKNQIMLCSSCGGAMILGDSQWRPFTKQDFAALPPQTKRALLVAVKGLEQTVGAGKEWSPYQQPPNGGN